MKMIVIQIDNIDRQIDRLTDRQHQIYKWMVDGEVGDTRNT